jgi:Tol biopolymer transport system component
MAEPSLGASPPESPLDDRLDSWKEIASYLKRDVTTVQRWEKREGMPVHRHLHDRIGSVYASRADLDAWMRTRNLRSSENGITVLDIPVAPAPLTPAKSSFLTSWTFFALLATAVAVLAIGVTLWLQHTEYFWRNPLANARFQTVTDFEGSQPSSAVSRDGNFIAFLSDRDGQPDVWVTQVGSGEFHNLTHGTISGLVNPSVRTPSFSPDGSLITFWVRNPTGSSGDNISVWAVPTLGGPPRPYLDGVAEFDWTRDSARLAYHTPGPGDPLFVTDGAIQPDSHPIFTAAPGLHSHFPLWSPDAAFIYFVQGTLPDKLDVWRLRPYGGPPEQITPHASRVTYPVFLDHRTLAYLATDPDGSGPWLYSIDTEHRIPHRLTSGLDRYTSLSASSDGRRLVATRATLNRTLWSLPLSTAPAPDSSAARIPLTTGTGFSPRLGPGYLLYLSSTPTGDGIWKITRGNGTQLWTAEGAQIFGGPAISPDGKHIAFSVHQRGLTLLYVMNSDGTETRVVTDSLELQGSPAWSPDGQSVISAVNAGDTPHLTRISLDGRTTSAVATGYSTDPAVAPDGSFIVYSGPDIGTTFALQAVTSQGATHPIPNLSLTRGARHIAFLPGTHSLVFLRGEIQHKNLWLLDLDTGSERQLTNISPGFDISDFDLSPDGSEAVLEQVHERSDVVLLDLPHP